MLLIHSERFAEHTTPPGHPERPERAEVMDVIASRWRERGCDVVAPRAATHEQLARVHDADYIRRIADTAGRAVALDPDTYTSPESYDVARLAAGAAVEAVERVVADVEMTALALVRPPGHHAERDRAMGFCLFNNVAVAAAHARSLGLERVAIVDYDVHHGNGTQHIFDADPHVLYISTHQFPYYPGTGAADEIGADEGCGFTVNIPIDAGALDEDYRVVFSEIVVPVLRQFHPDLVMVSAGFDAHGRDPLAGMRLTTPAFAAMTAEIRAVAADCCAGRIVVVTEGGYDLQALGASLDAVAQTLVAPRSAPLWPGADAQPSRGLAAVAQARAALSRFWSV
ncbi:MAG TPA: histone deacetylase [Vicinamibacterales bacterium]|nr:histone deacetylase [Vicinamibacterales bacterium]